MRKLLKVIIEKLGFGYLIHPRIRLARKYLNGVGVEIGALHNPTPLRKHVTAKYIDIATREESIKKFPELNPKDIVAVDYITNGFSLAGVPSGEFDFVIANHVLEHSPDPIGTLVQWHRVLKPGGILFCAVPLAEFCFDKGRKITTFEHMREDYEACKNGLAGAMAERNKVHYREWLEISEPVILKRPVVAPEVLEARIREMTESKEEIHFHTFTVASAQELFNRFGAEILPGFSVLEIVLAGGEVIAIARK